MSRLLLMLMLAGIVTGCATPATTATHSSPTPSPTAAPTPLDLLTFHTAVYHLGAWSNANGPMPHAKTGPRDGTGVRMTDVKGVLYNSPVIQAQDGAGALLQYGTSKDMTYLDLAKKDAQRLIDTHVTNAVTKDAWWFPYPFDYALYGDPTDTTIGPWYSGMAQGEAVYLFTRLYEITGDTAWKTAAIHAFHSLLYPLKAGEAPRSRPWATLVDSKGYYWIEEWTTPKPEDDTINGFGFATYGVIEYLREFHDPEATRVADAALTTYIYGVQHVRHPGGPSSYSLSHMDKLYTGYHGVVTSQLAVFAHVTGDPQFKTLYQEFYQDYH